MESSEISLLVQGPLNVVSLTSLKKHLPYVKNILVSHWGYRSGSEEEDILNKWKATGRVKDVISDSKRAKKGVGNSGYQFYSTLRGLRLIKTKYCIKHRSDEFYENLLPLIEQRGDKIVFGNMFFTNEDYHVSDHLFIGKTKILLAAYEDLNTKSNTITPEIALGRALLKAKGVKDLNDRKRNIRDHFNLVDINLLGDYIAEWRQVGVRYDSANPYKIYRTIEEVLE